MTTPELHKRLCDWCGLSFSTPSETELCCSDGCANNVRNFAGIVGTAVPGKRLSHATTRHGYLTLRGLARRLGMVTQAATYVRGLERETEANEKAERLSGMCCWCGAPTVLLDCKSQSRLCEAHHALMDIDRNLFMRIRRNNRADSRAAFEALLAEADLVLAEHDPKRWGHRLAPAAALQVEPEEQPVQQDQPLVMLEVTA